MTTDVKEPQWVTMRDGQRFNLADDDFMARLALAQEMIRPPITAMDVALAQEERRLAQAAPPPVHELDWLTLLAKDIPALRFAVPGLLPAGLAVIASPPKVGKSLLCYQMAVELQFGGMILGRKAETRPVLYYALEDGERRSQARIRAILGNRKPVGPGLYLRWDAPFLGGPLEAEVDEWLTQRPDGVLIIDVLAMVRPKGGKANAYDEDYSVLSGLHSVARDHPASTVLVVTHDRKAGADDWVTRITGTRGVSGVADTLIFINRKRGEPSGTIVTTSRDAGDDAINVTFSPEGWQPADISLMIGSMSPARVAIVAWLKDHGPAFQKAIAAGTGLAEDVVYHRVADMLKDGQVESAMGGYIVPEGAE